MGPKGIYKVIDKDGNKVFEGSFSACYDYYTDQWDAFYYYIVPIDSKQGEKHQ